MVSCSLRRWADCGGTAGIGAGGMLGRALGVLCDQAGASVGGLAFNLSQSSIVLVSLPGERCGALARMICQGLRP